MGQAKQRGSFEQRKLQAIKRNEELEKSIPKDHPIQKFLHQHGTQRLATKLVMAGALTYHYKPNENIQT